MRARIRSARCAVGDRGASAVEYGLMVAAIAAVIVGIVFGLGGMLNDTFSKTYNCIADGKQAAPTYPNCPTPPGGTP